MLASDVFFTILLNYWATETYKTCLRSGLFVHPSIKEPIRWGMNTGLFPGKSTKGRIAMNKEEISALTWPDFLFGLTGSTIFIVALYFITS